MFRLFRIWCKWVCSKWQTKIDGSRNPADLMTKYVATDVLQRLKTQLGVVSNW